MQRRPEELEDFKSRINLSEYAAACGYRLDRKASSRNSAVMVRSPGDKIIIALGTDRHWIYFAVGDSHGWLARRSTRPTAFCPFKVRSASVINPAWKRNPIVSTISP